MKICEGETGLNKWKVYEGNCLDILKNEIEDDSIDCVVTSPPYWNRRTYGQTANDVDGNIAKWMYSNNGESFKGEIGCNCSYKQYLTDLSAILNLIYKKIKNNKFVFINISNMHKNKQLIDISHDIIKRAKEVGFNHWDTIIWIKRNPMPPGRYREIFLSNGWEYILAFTKGYGFKINLDNYYYTNSHFKCKTCNDDNWLDSEITPNYFYSNIGCFGRAKRATHAHPAPFPIELPLYCLSIVTNKNDIILDPFAGSGTTLVAGLQKGLNVVGCELVTEIFTNLVDNLRGLDL